MSHNTEDMTKEKWLADCAARFKQCVPDANDEFCNEQAEICFESIGGDLTENGNSPFGYAGDRLWVRETCQAWEYELSGENVVRYVADGAFRPIEPTQNGMERWIDLRNYRGKKGAIVPSIHMPRWASRILPEITGVRIERLNDISEEDAKAEGADCLITANCTPQSRALLDMPLMDDDTPYRNGFALLWESINGDGSWAANPWVWVINNKVVKP